MSVLFICVDTARPRGVLAMSGSALSRGSSVALLTHDASGWPGLDPRVKVVELRRFEDQIARLKRAEQALTERVPLAIIAALQRALSLMSRAGARSVTARCSAVLTKARRRQVRAAAALDRRVFVRLHRALCLWWLIPQARRAGVPVSRVENVVVQDAAGLVVADLLKRSRADLPLCFELPDGPEFPDDPELHDDPAA